MKTKITLIAVLIIGLIGMGNPAFATEKKTKEAAPVAADTTMQSTQIEVKGIVKKTESGISLFDGNKTYLLEGDLVHENMIGNLVKVNGDLQKKENGATIIVEKAIRVN
ncbi:MAG: hypothetical protein GY860_04900 [Desulfobacteraceae bacterium]|nr:hypothetical protein [Desulfobacteraceae bacterium]